MHLLIVRANHKQVSRQRVHGHLIGGAVQRHILDDLIRGQVNDGDAEAIPVGGVEAAAAGVERDAIRPAARRDLLLQRAGRQIMHRDGRGQVVGHIEASAVRIERNERWLPVAVRGRDDRAGRPVKQRDRVAAEVRHIDDAGCAVHRHAIRLRTDRDADRRRAAVDRRAADIIGEFVGDIDQPAGCVEGRTVAAA